MGSVLDFLYKLWVEACPLSRIPARIGQHPCPTDTVIEPLVDVAMQAHRMLHFHDKTLQIGGVAGGQRIALELWWN